MKTRILYTKIWDKDFFAELSSDHKVIFLYYLLNDLVNIIHCYECPDRRVHNVTGIDRGIIANAKALFQEAGKIYFFGDFVYLKNAYKYEKYTGEKNEEAKRKILGQFSPEVKQWFEKISG